MNNQFVLDSQIDSIKKAQPIKVSNTMIRNLVLANINEPERIKYIKEKLGSVCVELQIQELIDKLEKLKNG